MRWSVLLYDSIYATGHHCVLVDEEKKRKKSERK